MVGLALLVALQGRIDSVRQTSYNQYTVTFAGVEPVFVNVDDTVIPKCNEPPTNPATRCVQIAGNVYTTTDIVPYGAKQLTQTGSPPFNMVIPTWRLQFSQATACCREPSYQAPNNPNANFNLYVPRVTVSGSSLTIEANRVAPLMTYAKLGDGTIVSLDAPIGGDFSATYPGTVSKTQSYSRTITNLPDMSTVDTIVACGAISGSEEACRTYTRNLDSPTNWDVTTSSTLQPPKPPPTPPIVPPYPMIPPSPPRPPYVAPASVGNGEYTRAPTSSSVDGATVAVVIFGVLLGILLVAGIYIYINKTAVIESGKRQRARSTMVRIPEVQMGEQPGNVA